MYCRRSAQISSFSSAATGRGAQFGPTKPYCHKQAAPAASAQALLRGWDVQCGACAGWSVVTLCSCSLSFFSRPRGGGMLRSFDGDTSGPTSLRPCTCNHTTNRLASAQPPIGEAFNGAVSGRLATRKGCGRSGGGCVVGARAPAAPRRATTAAAPTAAAHPPPPQPPHAQPPVSARAGKRSAVEPSRPRERECDVPASRSRRRRRCRAGPLGCRERGRPPPHSHPEPAHTPNSSSPSALVRSRDRREGAAAAEGSVSGCVWRGVGRGSHELGVCLTLPLLDVVLAKAGQRPLHVRHRARRRPNIPQRAHICRAQPPTQPTSEARPGAAAAGSSGR